MKRITLIFLSLICVDYVNAQIPSNCDVSSILQEYYDRDVKHLALKRIYEQQSPAIDSIIIPQNYQDTIWTALAAVYNLTNFPPRDTVFDIYCIHQYSSFYIFYSIYVSIEPTCPWLQQWKNLITTTGIPALDSLLSIYGFTVTYYSNYLNVATLTTSQTLNVRPVCDSIETFDGVAYSEPKPTDGDGDKINYTKIGTDRFFDFVIGYGDCLCGCTGSLTLKFQVYEDCSVQYLGSIFDPDLNYSFPSPVNCNISLDLEDVKNNNGFRIFPNPVSNILNIGTDLSTSINYLIINHFGQTVASGQITNEFSISTDDLPNGMYFLILNDIHCKKKTNHRFIKKN